MKKTTLILIGIIYIASIIIVSIFGLNAIVYKNNVPVNKVEISVVDEQDYVYMYEKYGTKIVQVEYIGEGNAETLEGTVVQLVVRVYPDNATNKEVKYMFDRESVPFVTMHTIDDRETGAIIISGIGSFEMRVYSTDGTNVYDTVWIDVVDRIPD
jgi:uncharacterized protein YkuJ